MRAPHNEALLDHELSFFLRIDVLQMAADAERDNTCEFRVQPEAEARQRFGAGDSDVDERLGARR